MGYFCLRARPSAPSLPRQYGKITERQQTQELFLVYIIYLHYAIVLS